MLQKLGLLELVDGDLDLTPEVYIIAAPGESPGHQLVRVHSQGHTLYCLGDLFHHPVEVEHILSFSRKEKRGTSRRSAIAFLSDFLAQISVGGYPTVSDRLRGKRFISRVVESSQKGAVLSYVLLSS